MEFQYIYNILIIIILFFIIFRKSNENFTNISKQDLEGLQNISSMFKKGELKISKLHVTDNAQFDKDIKTKQNIVFNNGNNWIMHAPNDHRHQLYIAPSNGKNTENWDWGKGLDWHSSGKMHIQDIHTRGDSTTAGNSHTAGTSTVDGQLQVNQGIGVKHDLHFNGGNNWILHTPDDKRHTLFFAPSSTYNKTDWNWSRGTEFLSDGGISAMKLRPKVGINHLWNGDHMALHSKTIMDQASATYGDIIPVTYNHNNAYYHRGGFMGKSVRHDGHVYGTFDDLTHSRDDALKHSNGHWWKWK